MKPLWMYENLNEGLRVVAMPAAKGAPVKVRLVVERRTKDAVGGDAWIEDRYPISRMLGLETALVELLGLR